MNSSQNQGLSPSYIMDLAEKFGTLFGFGFFSSFLVFTIFFSAFDSNFFGQSITGDFLSSGNEHLVHQNWYLIVFHPK
jgi:hypothetical protein